MSKFTRAINTFKNGLVSPRLRGSIVQPEDGSSAEILDNFIIDRSGAAVKRSGLKLLTVKTGATAEQYYKFNMLNKEYVFSFKEGAYFTDVDASYNSTYITTNDYPVKVFGTGIEYPTTGTYLPNTDLKLWNGQRRADGTMYPTGLGDYLHKALSVIHAEKISERTISVVTDNFAFLISLLDVTDEDNITTRKFYAYPYFVSGNLLLEALGKGRDYGTKCPICPSNFPFNSINTNPNITASFTALPTSGAALIGGATVSGVVTTTQKNCIFQLDILAATSVLDSVFTSLEGRFISVPSTDATKDVVFFITLNTYIGASASSYTCIQVIGGAVSATTQWKLSTWGQANHPKATGFCFGRLMYGNVKNSPSQWWAASIHPDNRQYLQGFALAPLLQDVSSNISGLNYSGVALASISTPTALTTIRDIYRWGFSDFSPTFGEINWITSRRRIHLGTSEGESQITIGNGSYTAASYDQNITGTDKSTLGGIAKGARRIFYIANSGKDIRSISTEDKDYESIDTLLSVPLTGLDLFFTKLEWVEELSSLVCTATDIIYGTNTAYLLSINTSTKIQAFSRIVTTKNFKGSAGKYFFLEDGTKTYKTSIELATLIYGTVTKNCYGDLFSVLNTDADIAAGAFANYYSTNVTLLHKGITYPFTVPSGVFSTSLLPFDSSEIGYGNGSELYVIADTYTALLKTLPIFEGAKFGSSMGDVQRVDRVSVLVDGSGVFKYGSEISSLISAENMSNGYLTEWDTKVVTVDLPQSPDREQFVYIESSTPTPLNISSISLRGVSYSGE